MVATTQQKKLLVVVVTYNAEKIIEACLDSVARQTADHDLLLIDNASTDGTVKVVSEFQQAHPDEKIELWHNDANVGFARAVNIGLARMVDGAPYGGALLLNPDTFFPPHLFADGLAVLEKNPAIGCCSPAVLYPDGRLWWTGTRVFSPGELLFSSHYNISEHTGKGQAPPAQPDPLIPVEAVSGCAMFLRAAAVKKVGLLDERFYMYAEDIDYSLRLKKAGFRLACFTTVTLTHDTADNGVNLSKSGRRKYRIYLTSTGHFIKKHYGIGIFALWLIFLPFKLGSEYARRRAS